MCQQKNNHRFIFLLLFVFLYHIKESVFMLCDTLPTQVYVFHTSSFLGNFCDGPPDPGLRKPKWPEDQVERIWNLKSQADLKEEAKPSYNIARYFINHSFIFWRDEVKATLPTDSHECTGHNESTFKGRCKG